MVFWRRSVSAAPRTALDLPRGGPGATASLEERVQAIGRNLLASARDQRTGRLSRRFWSDQLMQWAMRDPAFKVQLLRFVDLFPTLHSAKLIHDHLQQYLAQPGVAAPMGLSLGLKAGSLFRRSMADTVASRITAMAEKFILAADVQAALARVRDFRGQGMTFSLDLLGEACVSDAEARAYQRRYLALIDVLSRETAAWPIDHELDTDHIGPIPRANVSVKISSLSARIKPADSEGSIQRLIEALAPILESAAQNNVLINFDMEQHDLKDLTIDLFERCCERFRFPAGLALQAYLRSGPDDARRLIDWAKRAGRQVTVRLIKGAYWDYEVIRADTMGWPCPVWRRKQETDACFERMAAMFLAQMPRKPDAAGVKLAIGSHNVRSIAAALALAERHNLPARALEFQMLYGMADELKAALVRDGLRLRVYAPVGEMIPGMAYLVRRLLENTSNESWLRAGFAEDASPQALLVSPHEAAVGTQSNDDRIRRSRRFAQIEEHSQRTAHSVATGSSSASAAVPGIVPNSEDSSSVDNLTRDGGVDGQAFRNEPQRDFSSAAVRTEFARAIRRTSVPKVPIDATVSQVREAIVRASDAFAAWGDTPVRKRAAVMVEAARIMRRRRDELAGVIIRESGKTWAEADADVCEAIDFAEFYSRQAIRLFEPVQLGRLAGEFNQQWHQPRGVAAIISPWNFPLSICAGMTTAALVTGNSAVVKPAEQTPAIARIMCEILWQAGVPRDVLHFVPGAGQTVGVAMVRDPRVAIIAFTGSKAVGLDILAAAAQTPGDQPHVKHVIVEMGGKNAIIIDESADLDVGRPGGPAVRVQLQRPEVFRLQPGHRAGSGARSVPAPPGGEHPFTDHRRSAGSRYRCGPDHRRRGRGANPRLHRYRHG